MINYPPRCSILLDRLAAVKFFFAILLRFPPQSAIQFCAAFLDGIGQPAARAFDAAAAEVIPCVCFAFVVHLATLRDGFTTVQNYLQL
jgi:hypothetical protein